MLDALDQVSLNEIARMAWGSGSREEEQEVNGEIESANKEWSYVDDRLKAVLDHVREGKPYSDLFPDKQQEELMS